MHVYHLQFRIATLRIDTDAFESQYTATEDEKNKFRTHAFVDNKWKRLANRPATLIFIGTLAIKLMKGYFYIRKLIKLSRVLSPCA